MNWSGPSTPCTGWDQRTSASAPQHGTVHEADQRLVLHEELAVPQRAGQLVGQPVPGDGAGVRVGVGDLVAVAAALLGAVHRDVGAAQHVGCAAGADLAVHDADAAVHRQLAVVEQHRGGERLQDAACQVRDGGQARRVGVEGDELVAADPGDQLVGRGDAVAQPVGDGDQQPVAHRVAEAVVDRLEAVQVEVADADPAVGAVAAPGARLVRCAERAVEAFEEQRAVGQSCERVVGGLVAQPLQQPAALGDVFEQGELVLRAAFCVAQQRDLDVGPQHRAVGPGVGLLDAVVVAFAAGELAVQDVVAVRAVVRVRPVAGPAVPDVRLAAEHPGERLVDLQHVAFEVGDADADGGGLEDRTEAGLACGQRALRLGLGVQRGTGDRLLLVQGAFAQRVREADGDRVLEP
jgi:hypothetical protein